MKMLFWIGLVVAILGIVSFLVPIPRNERQGIEAGGHRGMYLETDVATQIGTFALVRNIAAAVAGTRALV